MNDDSYDYQNFAFYVLGLAYLRDGENSSQMEEIFESCSTASKMFGKALASNTYDQASYIKKKEVDAKLQGLKKGIS